MPLLFALVGLVALLLAALVLLAPVLLIGAIIRGIRTGRARRRSRMTVSIAAEPQATSPLDACLTDTAFADLVLREWPEEARSLRTPGA